MKIENLGEESLPTFCCAVGGGGVSSYGAVQMHKSAFFVYIIPYNKHCKNDIKNTDILTESHPQTPYPKCKYFSTCKNFSHSISGYFLQTFEKVLQIASKIVSWWLVAVYAYFPKSLQNIVILLYVCKNIS